VGGASPRRFSHNSAEMLTRDLEDWTEGSQRADVERNQIAIWHQDRPRGLGPSSGSLASASGKPVFRSPILLCS
jgi:hypothetical protein